LRKAKRFGPMQIDERGDTGRFSMTLWGVDGGEGGEIELNRMSSEITFQTDKAYADFLERIGGHLLDQAKFLRK